MSIRRKFHRMNEARAARLPVREHQTGAKISMPPIRDSEPRQPLRADARDNRRRLLEAARDVFIDRGPGAPLEEIARRAGTGIATLYRRFPDRRALIRDVVLDALQRTADEARQSA